MSRAFTKENDDRASGSVVDRFYQGVLGLSDPARDLIARRQQEVWMTKPQQIEAARQAALAALGQDSYREVFDSATQRAGDPQQSPTWWAVGDAAVGIASRRRLSAEQFSLLVAPLSVAMPWLREAAHLG
jgi:methylmalonyl-CoA mutase N-terminal domain/subunit